MKTLPTLFLLMWLPLFGYAQDSTIIKVTPRKYFQVDFRAGYLKNDHSALNNSLQSYGFQAISENLITYSFSSKFIFNRFVFGIGATGFHVPSQSNPNDIKTKLGGNGADFSVGYILLEKQKFRLYPFVGINQRFAQLKFEDTSPQNMSSLGDVLTNRRREGQINFNSASLDIGIQMEKLIDLKTTRVGCPQNVPHLAIGLRAGYHFLFNNGERGEFNNQSIENAPRFGIKGPYVQINLGLGQRVGQYKWK
jgi:hypothetical protein